MYSLPHPNLWSSPIYPVHSRFNPVPGAPAAGRASCESCCVGARQVQMCYAMLRNRLRRSDCFSVYDKYLHENGRFMISVIQYNLYTYNREENFFERGRCTVPCTNEGRWCLKTPASFLNYPSVCMYVGAGARCLGPGMLGWWLPCSGFLLYICA